MTMSVRSVADEYKYLREITSCCGRALVPHLQRLIGGDQHYYFDQILAGCVICGKTEVFEFKLDTNSEEYQLELETQGINGLCG